MNKTGVKIALASAALAVGTGVQANAAVESSELITTFNITVGASIDAQTLDEAEEVTNNYLDNLQATNGVTKDTIINSLSKVVNTKQGFYTLSISDWSMKEATETSRGYLSFNVIIKDTKGNVKTCPYNLKYIPALAQSPETIKQLYAERLKTYSPTNNTAEQDIINLVQITNDDIKVKITEFKLEPATSVTSGHLTGFVNVWDSTVSSEDQTPVPIDIIVQPNKYELSTAANKLREYLNSYNWTNDVDFGQLLIDLNNTLNNQNISISYGYGEYAPAIKPATPNESGKVTGRIILTGKDSMGSTSSISMDLGYTIGRLPQDLNSAYSAVVQKYSTYIATNVSSADDIVVYLLPCITSDNIEIRVDNFQRVDATESVAGSITGTITVIDKNLQENNSKSFELNKAITKIPQTALGIIGLLTNTQDVLTVTNDTTEESLRSTLQTLVSGASGSSMTVSTSDFSINPATTSSPGTINIKASVRDADNNVSSTNLVYTIARLNIGSNEAADNIGNQIPGMTDDDKKGLTDISSLEDYLRKLLGLAGNDVTFDMSHVEFKPATEVEPGYVRGYVLITDKSNNQTKLPLDIYLPPTGTQEEITNNIQKELEKILKEKITSLDDLNKLLDELRKKYPGYDIGMKDPKVDPATPEKDGKIDFTITIIGPDGKPMDILYTVYLEKIKATADYIKSLIDRDNFQSLDDLMKLLEELKKKYPGFNFDIGDIKTDPAGPGKPGSITGPITIITPAGETKVIEINKIIEKGAITNNYIQEKLKTDRSFRTLEELQKWLSEQINTILPGSTVDISKIISNGGQWTGELIIKDKDGNTFNPAINVKRDYSSSSSGSHHSHSSSSDDDNDRNDRKTVDPETSGSTVTGNTSTVGINGLFSGGVNVPYSTDAKASGVGLGMVNDNVLDLIKVDNVQGNSCLIKSDKGETIKVSKCYEYIPEVTKYVYKPDVNISTVSNDSVQFITQNGKSYILSNNDLDNAFLANAGWNKANPTPAGDSWYFMNNSNLQKGWVNDGSHWYHLDESSGKMDTGWINKNGKWYYLHQESDGTRGRMITGWIYSGTGWYHLNESSGGMDTGWLYKDGSWYYLNTYSGKMSRDTTETINGVNYSFDASGRLI